MPVRSFLNFRGIAGSHRLMLVLICAAATFTLLLGDMVPANDGLGWDGVMYAALTRNVFQMISDGELNSYYAQRLLPSVIVRGLLMLAQLPLDNPHIVKGFFVYNFALLIGANMLWKQIADGLAITLRGRWLGFASLFINFAVSKQTFYYPVLTDTTALFIGMLLLLFYVQKRPLALLVTAWVGAFAWQVVGLSGAILLLFMNVGLSSQSIEPASEAAVGRTARLFPKQWGIGLIGLSVAAAVIIVIEYLTATLIDPFAATSLTLLLRAASSAVTGIPALALVVVGIGVLVNSRAVVNQVIGGLGRIDMRLVLMALAAVAVPGILVRWMANPEVANPSGIRLVANAMVMPPDKKMLLSLVTNFVFWGPMIALLLTRWKSFGIEARRLGPGFMGVVALSIVLCLVAEPRFMTSGWPFLVLGGVLAMEKIIAPRAFLFGFAALTVVLAQFWLKLNVAPWRGDAYGDLQDYPKQIFFMHYGLWMGWPAYLAQSVVLGATVVWMRYSLRYRSR